MFDTGRHRRRFLCLVGATAVTGLAGCTTTPTTGERRLRGGESTTATRDAPVAPSGGVRDGVTHHDEMPHDGMADETDGHHHDGETGSATADEAGDGSSDGPVGYARVQMISTDRGSHFDPHVVWVIDGGTVQWTNASGFHTTTSYSPANDRPRLTPDGPVAWDSGLLTAPGETFEQTFDVEGVYHYFCLPHERQRMIGTVVVGYPTLADQPALAAPPETLSERVRRTLEQRNADVEALVGG